MMTAALYNYPLQLGFLPIVVARMYFIFSFFYVLQNIIDLRYDVKALNSGRLLTSHYQIFVLKEIFRRLAFTMESVPLI